MKCPSCGKEIDGNLKFCSHCGIRLQVHYCSQCGNVLSGDKKFCEKCGAPNQFYQCGTAPAPSAANGTSVGSATKQENPAPMQGLHSSYTVYSQSTAAPIENTATPAENTATPTENTGAQAESSIIPEQASQTEETVNTPEPKEEAPAADAKAEESEAKQASEEEAEYEVEEIKGGKGKVFLVLFLILILGGGGFLLGQRLGWWHIPALSWVGGADATESDDEYVDAGNFVEGSQGMLKAFGLKGKVKTLTFECVDFDNRFTFAFDPDGNFRETPDYNGGETVMNSVDVPVYCDLKIDSWLWKQMGFSGRNVVESVYDFTGYDEYNRPENATVSLYDEVSKSNVAITYSGSDSHGNYTTIKLATEGATPYDSAMTSYLLKTLKVKIEYWPDDATMADVPTELTESKAIEIIKKANRKESEALTHDFNRFLQIRDVVPTVGSELPEFGGDGSVHFNEGISTGTTLLADYDNMDIPNVRIKVENLQIHDSGETATVAFYFSDIYEGKPEDAYAFDLSDNEAHFVTAEMKFENGKWVVDDIGYEVVYAYGSYVHGDSYRHYYDNLDIVLEDIRSGKIESDIRETFREDPKMEEYLKKVEEFKKKFDIK